MITVEEYLMGRDKDYPLDMLQARNMATLLSRVNWLLGTLGKREKVSSGYRPSAINAKVGGAVRSAHLSCEAVDLLDTKGELAKAVLQNLSLVIECDLYVENPEKTKGWLHLQSRKTRSGNRIFNP